ncbi:MAG: DUF951 domain-containing protein [Coriobacteriales bacterium]|nr:DUF951 domain-containing protein [Coriobacteriales bacterium]
MVARPGGRYTRYTARSEGPSGFPRAADIIAEEEARVAVPIVPVKVGDVVRLKKPHPCGTNEWEIDRIGADIGLKCQGCGRRVMLPRSEFDRRFRGFIRRADESREA